MAVTRDCLLRLLAALALVAATQAQSYTFGQCPNYQTTPDFTQDYIKKMVEAEAGYILALTSGSTDTCQTLNLTSDTAMEYRFTDTANFPRNYTGSYEISAANLSQPAQLSLTLLPRMLGSNLMGDLTLYPLVAQDDLVVFVSCDQFGLLKAEQVLAFVPYPSTGSPTSDEIRATLAANAVPLADRMLEVNQNCVPQARRAPSPVALRLYFILPNQNNPLRIGAFAANRNRAAPSVLPFRASNDVQQEFINSERFRNNFQVPLSAAEYLGVRQAQAAGEEQRQTAVVPAAAAASGVEDTPFFYTSNFQVPVFYGGMPTRPAVAPVTTGSGGAPLFAGYHSIAAGYSVPVFYSSSPQPVYQVQAPSGASFYSPNQNSQNFIPANVHGNQYTQFYV